MASAQSASLGAVPGYAPQAPTTAAFSPQFPAMPTLPDVKPLANDGNLPYFTARQQLGNQLAQLPNQQNAALTQIQAGAKQALAGYGGYSFQQDNPNTPQREDLLLNYNPNNPWGVKEHQAAANARNQANAAGLMQSSFATQNIASAVQRTSLEAQQVINQYAQAVNNTETAYANQASQIASQYASLYGQDAMWAVQNPPPPPPGADLAPTQAAASQAQASANTGFIPGFHGFATNMPTAMYPNRPIPGFQGFATNVPKKGKR